MAIKVEGPNVYVGGTFTGAGGVLFADYLARWDGTSWNAVGPGFSGAALNGWVRAIEAGGAWVAIGGDFTNAGGQPLADHVAVWNGSAWLALPPGLDHWVRTLESVGPDLYAGGDFEEAGGADGADLIARWGTVFEHVYLPLGMRE
jgi:hypothetical protein